MIGIVTFLFMLVSFIFFWNDALAKTFKYDNMQYSPSGQIPQIEYAKKAAGAGLPIAALTCKDAVVLVAVKNYPAPKFQIEGPQHLHHADSHVVVLATGHIFDGNSLAEAARKICSKYREKFSCPIPVERLCGSLADVIYERTIGHGMRPMGIRAIVAGYDAVLGSQVYSLDPEGSFVGWKAVCLGKGSTQIMSALQRRVVGKHPLSAEDGCDLIHSCLKACLPSVNDKDSLKISSGDFDGWKLEMVVGRATPKGTMVWSEYPTSPF